MSAQLELKVQSKDNSKFQFVPASLTLKIGDVNSDMKTVDMYFELKDNGEFDTSIYKGLERIQRGNMDISLDLVAQLMKEDGTHDIDVINQIFSASFIEVTEDTAQVPAIEIPKDI